MFGSKQEFKDKFVERLERKSGRKFSETSVNHQYQTLGSMMREYISKDWIATNSGYRDRGEKQVYYFSMEFLLGRLLESNLLNMDVQSIVEEGLNELGLCLENIVDVEPDAGLGNGGLGRLAACFLDSLASLQLPGHGCGIRYKYGLFEQKIVNGHQVELPDYWLREGNVWEIRRSDRAFEVKFGGKVWWEETGGRMVFHHEDAEKVLAVPYDMPVIGYKNRVVNTLRLWSAEIANIDLAALDSTSYRNIVEYKRSVEQISEFLYPDDSNFEGKVLRLKQQYFLVSAGVQSIIRTYKAKNRSIKGIERKIAIHINDTHPVLVIPELMRIFMDEEQLTWDQAWHATTQICSYTNHTILSEALETWPVDMFESLLPRIFMIVREINERYCKHLWELYPYDWNHIGRLAIIADDVVKMAHLAVVGSHSVNGVAKLHTEILITREMKSLYDVFPEKFNNKTNGITHRRWLMNSNPLLSELITETIGDRWLHAPTELLNLKAHTKDAGFRSKVHEIKMNNKKALAELIYSENGIKVDEHSIFDVQIKRLHAYKRQLLNVFHIMDLYRRLKDNPNLDVVPRTFIFGAKAAPGYYYAKRIIQLINALAKQVNHDPAIKDKIKIVFLENYRVSLAEKIIPATDVSEQISTASKEASGTGNMKFMMNGALTLGTLDGANVEILDEVGENNIFIFGLKADEVMGYYQHGGYRAWDMVHSDDRLHWIVDQLLNGSLSPNHEEFRSIYDSLIIHNDEYFVLKDFAAYVEAQNRVNTAYQNQDLWLEMSIRNISHSGVFSSDRTIMEYARGIWGLNPILVNPGRMR
jgi:starch phosphorylase